MGEKKKKERGGGPWGSVLLCNARSLWSVYSQALQIVEVMITLTICPPLLSSKDIFLPPCCLAVRVKMSQVLPCALPPVSVPLTLSSVLGPVLAEDAHPARFLAGCRDVLAAGLWVILLHFLYIWFFLDPGSLLALQASFFLAVRIICENWINGWTETRNSFSVVYEKRKPRQWIFRKPLPGNIEIIFPST